MHFCNLYIPHFLQSRLYSLSGKESTCQYKRCKRHGFDPCAGKIPWKILFQYSCLENSMGRGAWRAVVHEATESQTRLINWTHTMETFIEQLNCLSVVYFSCIFQIYSQPMIRLPCLWIHHQGEQTHHPPNSLLPTFCCLPHSQPFGNHWSILQPCNFAFSRISHQ